MFCLTLQCDIYTTRYVESLGYRCVTRQYCIQCFPVCEKLGTSYLLLLTMLLTFDVSTQHLVILLLSYHPRLLWRGNIDILHTMDKFLSSKKPAQGHSVTYRIRGNPSIFKRETWFSNITHFIYYTLTHIIHPTPHRNIRKCTGPNEASFMWKAQQLKNMPKWPVWCCGAVCVKPGNFF